MTSRQIPRTTRSVVIQKQASAKKPVYHDAVIVEKEIPALQRGEVLVRMSAAAYNHREHWQRKGVVVAAHDPKDALLEKRVFLTPMRGWKSDPEAPEGKFATLGGGRYPPIGTFSEYVVVERDEVIPSPSHLDDVHAAAWPLAGLTAWRAAIVNANVQSGHRVLITGIGGGVAITALQICLAQGATVYVTSSSADKIKRAVELGAKAGFNYRDEGWAKQLGAALKKEGAVLNSVIDGSGGDILTQTTAILKHGGRVVVYGTTAAPIIPMTMPAVLRNQKLIGSTMGSRKDLEDATTFMAKHKIVPVVSDVLDGLDAVEQGFDLIKRGGQFGKIVIDLQMGSKAKL
ncbi:NAD(P)-binding protein [Schizophyllum commune Loenen D]|nr:NAD(P)-binding protein [Schizophyllum commune Loenen D]